MNILKYIGIAAGAFIGLSILIFFLYPYIHPERAEEARNRQIDEEEPMDRSILLPDGKTTSGVYENMTNELEELQRENEALRARLDSLGRVKDTLITERDELQEQKEKAEAVLAESGFSGAGHEGADSASGRAEAGLALAGTAPGMDDEAFSERVKSLLNLDEEELAAIVKHMDEDQLVLLYRNSGNIQREKLLRSLVPERAAKLMRTVML